MMQASATTDLGCFELRRPRSESEWAAYHSIRERGFYVPLGLDKEFGPYDPGFPDQFRSDYTPLVMVRNGIVVATMGFQDMGDGLGQVRAVAVEPACQRRGYGSVMLTMAEDWARRHGFQRIWVRAHETAVMFYARCAYTYGAASDLETGESPVADSVVMAKRLASGMRRRPQSMMIAAA